MALNREEVLEKIKEVLEKDLIAADLKICLFISAAQSYKKDFLLNPFPSFYFDQEMKNFDKLLEDLEQIPAADELLVMMLAETWSQLNDSVIKVIHWILTQSRFFEIETVPKNEYEKILSLAKNKAQHQLPNYIFKVKYENSGAERKFQMLSRERDFGSKYAFHGTKFYNIYTILSYGLHQHLNKTNLFGEGLYFAFELQISALFSPSVLSWKKSKIGELISSVALCEYIDDPRHYKIQKENAKANDIPQNYLLITNNEIVRVRYLLLYGTKKPSLNTSLSKDKIESLQSESFSILAWCRRNPLIVSAFLYVSLLALVGLNQSRSVEHYKNIVKSFLKKRLKFE